MTKEEFYELIKQWSYDTCFKSYQDMEHPAYIKAVQAGEEVIPWALERLKDSIGHDHGNTYDHANSPWFTTCLIGELTKDEWAANIPEADFHEEYAGRLDKIRECILQWGETKGLIKLS
jgi:hypothetical protein